MEDASMAEMEGTSMAIADSRYLWTEMKRLKTQVSEMRAASRQAQDEREKMADALASFVTRAQLDAAMSTKVSLAHVDAQMETVRSTIATQLEQKADLAALATLQSTKLDVSMFDATALDLPKLRATLEQHVHDLFATFAAQLERQVSTKVPIADFNRIFNPDAVDQSTSLETAALRISKMANQLESFSDYVNGEQHRQQQVAELHVSMLDVARRQTAARSSIGHLVSAEQTMAAQLRALDKKTSQALANVVNLTETLSTLQTQVQADKRAQDTRQLANDVKQLEAQSQLVMKSMSTLEEFTQSGFITIIDAKLMAHNDKLRRELNDIHAVQRQQAQQVTQRINKVNEHYLLHKDRLAQVEKSIGKLMTLWKQTQEEVDEVKGPLATLVTNLHQENVAIVQEIERTQDGTRHILLDYHDLLEQQKNSHVLPCRPSSTLSSATTRLDRKYKQQMLLATKMTDRPHTSSPRTRGMLDSSLPRSACILRNSRLPTPSRAQTARARPHFSEMSNNGNHVKGKDEQLDSAKQQEVRETALVEQNSDLALFKLINTTEELFHFPRANE